MPAQHQDSAQQLQSRRRPAEYYIDEKWDRCIDLTLRRVTYSSLAAGAVALVLLRGGGVRAATTAFGAGFGAGSAYGDCQREFQGEVPSIVHPGRPQ
ncbi:hypothetical protein ABBQ38_000684 [Trebouxia sp. C0009 RCD-2024]